MFKNVATKVALFAFDATTGLAKSGDAANLTAYVSKDWGAVTVLADTSATEMEATNAKGWYLFDVAQAEANADVCLFTGKSVTANVSVVGMRIDTTPASFTSDVVQTGDNYARIGAAGAGLTALGDTRIANLDAAISTRASPTNITAGTITTVTNLTNAATAGDLTATMKTSVGTAVAASAVASVTGNVGGSVGSVVGAVGSVTAPVSLTGDLTATMKTSVTTAATAATPIAASVTGAVGSVTGLNAANLDVAVSTRASPTNITAGVITTVTNLTNAPTAGDLTATMKTSVTTAATAATPIAASVTGAVGSVTGLTAANLDVAVSTRMATYSQPTGFLAATFPGGTIANTTNITAATVTTDVTSIGGSAEAATNLKRGCLGTGICTVGTGSTISSIVTSSMDPAAAAIDQFKGRIITFDRATTTTNLRGQATDITGSTAGGILTVTALTTAPVSGDLFVIT